jgi:hypothetical protein
MGNHNNRQSFSSEKKTESEEIGKEKYIVEDFVYPHSTRERLAVLLNAKHREGYVYHSHIQCNPVEAVIIFERK